MIESQQYHNIKYSQIIWSRWCIQTYNIVEYLCEIDGLGSQFDYDTTKNATDQFKYTCIAMYVTIDHVFV